MPSTYHLIDAAALAKMKRGAMLINTGRGGLVESNALVGALKDGQLGHLGLDVYEEEGGLFFEGHSNLPLQDDVLARLLMSPNVIVTAHQAFFTREAMNEIAHTTLDNIAAWQTGVPRNTVPATGRSGHSGHSGHNRLDAARLQRNGADRGAGVVRCAAHLTQQGRLALVHFHRKPARAGIGKITRAMLAIAKRHHTLALETEPAE